MTKPAQTNAQEPPEALFGRIVSILEQARGNVVRAVNSNMVWAYWLIGREIVEELQGGAERAEYGKKVIEDLSVRLNEKYGSGFSEQSLQNFRRFYLAYSERFIIPSPLGREFGSDGIIQKNEGSMGGGLIISSPVGRESEDAEKRYSQSDESQQGFSPQLSWSHYRALMRVENTQARDFYKTDRDRPSISTSQSASAGGAVLLLGLKRGLC